MLDIVPSCEPVQYQGKLMMQPWEMNPMQFKGKLMNQTWENDKKPNVGPNFGLFVPNFGPQILFQDFTSISS